MVRRPRPTARRPLPSRSHLRLRRYGRQQHPPGERSLRIVARGERRLRIVALVLSLVAFGLLTSSPISLLGRIWPPATHPSALADATRLLGTSGALTYALLEETTLVVLRGTVEVQRGGRGAFTSATGDTIIRQGDTVRTGPNSYAAITFFDGSTTSVVPETLLTVKTLEKVGNPSTISLQQEISPTWNRVERLVDANGRYETTAASTVGFVYSGAYRVPSPQPTATARR